MMMVGGKDGADGGQNGWFYRGCGRFWLWDTGLAERRRSEKG